MIHRGRDQLLLRVKWRARSGLLHARPVSTGIGAVRVGTHEMVGPYRVHLELEMLQELYENLGDRIRAEYANSWQHVSPMNYLLLLEKFDIFLWRL